MFLNKLNIYDFRQFEKKESGEPSISVLFNSKFNLIIGENDSGKSTIIDAIRYLLGTLSDDYQKISDEDFNNNAGVMSERIEIDAEFKDLSSEEVGSFLEWISFDNKGNNLLRISLVVEKKLRQSGNYYFDKTIKAGDRNSENIINSEARSILQTTYLKPLRDAQQELTPGYRSRLAQILRAHPAFETTNGEKHELVNLISDANSNIEDYFRNEYVDGHSITSDLENILEFFYDNHDSEKVKSDFKIASADLTSILKKLSLNSNQENLGLGNQNLLFIATEFLLLKDFINPDKTIGPNIVLIEEIEAHLHTQAQIRLIKFLERQLSEQNKGQFILTTHSNEIVSSVNPEYLILIKNQSAYPIASKYTEMTNADTEFLNRFFDSTKSNAFFAKGLILVEGDSENLFIPSLAEFLNIPLHHYGVSIMNVRGTSFERYIKMFSRNSEWQNIMGDNFIEIPISIVTDSDIKPAVYYKQEEIQPFYYSLTNEDVSSGKLSEIAKTTNQIVDDFIDENIGIKFSTAKKLCKDINIKYNNNNIDKISDLVKKQYTEEHISFLKHNKIYSENLKYDNYNADISLQISPEWTLEFSLALSSLRKLLFKVIHCQRYKEPFKGEKNKQYEEMCSKIDSSYTWADRQSVAYQIFKPINDKIVSKAEVAQELGREINSLSTYERDKLSEEVLSDEYLEYLVKAIRHSCGLAEEQSYG